MSGPTDSDNEHGEQSRQNQQDLQEQQDSQDPQDHRDQPPLHRLRSMALSERPTPTSGASVLSLANAHVAAGLASDDAERTTPAPQSQPGAPPRRAPSAGTPDAQTSKVGSGESPPESQGGRQAGAPFPANVAEMRDRFSLGDYTGALAAAELLLAEFPDHIEAKRCADNCRSVLEQMYAARIGPLDRIPHVAVPREKLQWLSIDHRAGFVLSHVDGVSSLQMIMAACGMPLLDVLRILHELVHSRVIAFR